MDRTSRGNQHCHRDHYFVPATEILATKYVWYARSILLGLRRQSTACFSHQNCKIRDGWWLEEGNQGRDEARRCCPHSLTFWKVKVRYFMFNVDDLILWKVSILVDHSFKDTISQLKFEFEDGQSLLPMAKLSKVFADAPEENHLHIVVRVPSPEPEFDLKCSVLKSDSVFSVKMPKSGTVDGLKDAIKKKMEPEFDHVAAVRIDLWKVQVSNCCPRSDILVLTISTIEGKNLRMAIPATVVSNRTSPSSPLKMNRRYCSAENLSAVFSDPLNQQHLHIVVRVPPKALSPSCEPKIRSQLFQLAWGWWAELFSVKIPKSGTVDSLKKAIKKEKERCIPLEVDADRLDLWKVSIPDDDRLIESVRKLDLVNNRCLRSTAKLSKVFADAPEDHHIHIVVRASTWNCIQIVAELTLMTASQSFPSHVLLHTITQILCSIFGISGLRIIWAKLLPTRENQKTLLLTRRKGIRHFISTALLSPPRQYLSRCTIPYFEVGNSWMIVKVTKPTEEKDHDFALKFSRNMSGFYDNEDKRKKSSRICDIMILISVPQCFLCIRPMEICVIGTCATHS